VYETLGALRTAEPFDIIVAYPDSILAVENLQHCLQNTNHHAQVVQSLRVLLQRRLLQPGAVITDILARHSFTLCTGA